MLKDTTGSIELLAWGQRMVTCLIATSILPQKVFAFQRLKYKTFQDKPQLYLNEGAEIFLTSDHDKFTQLCNHYNNTTTNRNNQHPYAQDMNKNNEHANAQDMNENNEHANAQDD